jgi:hypothetical protein
MYIYKIFYNFFVTLYIQWTSGHLCVEGSKDPGSRSAEPTPSAQAMQQEETDIVEQEFVWNERESPWSRHLYIKDDKINKKRIKIRERKRIM